MVRRRTVPAPGGELGAASPLLGTRPRWHTFLMSRAGGAEAPSRRATCVGPVQDLTDRLQWALREAIRVSPSEFDYSKEA
jgi:hypothetical protein